MNNQENNSPVRDFSPVDKILEDNDCLQTNLITILQQIQARYGYLPKDIIFYVAGKTGLSPADIMGVATFYSQFRLTPIGKYLIMSCQGTACHVNASEKVMAAVCEYLGIEDGQTTDDGLFTLEKVACLGCCSLAPVIMINGEAHSNLTPEKAVNILKEIKAREGVK